MLKRGIFSKIFVLIMTMSLIVGIVILVITIKERTKAIGDSLIQENKILAEVASKNIESGYYASILPLETLRLISNSESILFLWVVQPNGEIYLSNDPQMLGRVVDDPSLGTEKVVVKDSLNPEDGKKIKLIIQPVNIKEQEKKPWALFLGVSLEQVAAAQRGVIFTSLGFFAIAIILTALVAFYLTRVVTSPLNRLKEGVEIIGRGNLDHRIKLKTGDEFENLAGSFNQMAVGLKKSQAALEEAKTVLEIKVQARTRELKELAEDLENKVKERTQEIRARLEELERFQSLTIGRELKMIELKKELAKLEKAKKNYGSRKKEA